MVEGTLLDMIELKYENLDFSNSDDVTQVAKIHCDTPREWVANHSYSADAINKVIEKLRSPDHIHHVVVAREPVSDRITGVHWVQLEISPESRIGHIHSLWVHPEFRQRGVATHLKEMVEDWLRQNEASEIRTQVHVENAKMISLNKKLGYNMVRIGMSKPIQPKNEEDK